MGIEDDYVAFCFNEACEYIKRMLESEGAPAPKWIDVKKRVKENNNNQEAITMLLGS